MTHDIHHFPNKHETKTMFYRNAIILPIKDTTTLIFCTH
jgi:hypothetical protein